MKLEYGLTGSDRKKLVAEIEKLTGLKAKYLFMPTCAYEIGNITVDKEGTVTSEEDLSKLKRGLEEMGFFTLENIHCSQDDTSSEELNLSITIPADKVNFENLTKILKAKEQLIKKALKVNDLPIKETDEGYQFPWFFDIHTEDLPSYALFIEKLAAHSVELKWVSEKEKEVPNDKYAFRCFLLRLGFIGSQFKKDRMVLLKNLTGSSAFREGKNNE